MALVECARNHTSKVMIGRAAYLSVRGPSEKTHTLEECRTTSSMEKATILGVALTTLTMVFGSMARNKEEVSRFSTAVLSTRVIGNKTR